MFNKDEIQGTGKQIEGKVKDKVGEWTNNPDLEAEGEAEHAEGTVQQKVGKVVRKVEDFVKE